MKYSIEYKRTVRVRDFETLAIGMVSEFAYEDMTPNEAKKIVRDNVNKWIFEELKELRQRRI